MLLKPPSRAEDRIASVRTGSVDLSVIVPFAADETEGEALLRQLGALPETSELILVRAGSASLSYPQATKTGAARVRECLSPPGRARQMNAGAQVARGHWLWFLHADSRLHAHTLDALRAFLAGGDALGWFDLRYRNDGPRLAWLNALGANLRSRWLGLPFGDQGLVLPASWFRQSGGYDESVAYGEDHLLVWHAHAAGLPVRRIGAPLSSSARKYAEQGWRRTTARHVRLTVRQAWPQWRAWRRARGASRP